MAFSMPRLGDTLLNSENQGPRQAIGLNRTDNGYTPVRSPSTTLPTAVDALMMEPSSTFTNRL